MNIELAHKILVELKNQGVQTICLCPGARNAPFVELLSRQKDIEVIGFFDERSAGFFALGRAQREGQPVVVCTTSGTAVSELMSPMIEAYYSSTPLIVLSSDRPKRLRGTGAPQAIEQSHMFKQFVESSFDLEGDEEFHFQLTGRQPAHINVCFDEPLLDSPINDENHFLSESKWVVSPLKNLSLNLAKFEKPLVVVGRLSFAEKQVVEKELSALDLPIFVEASSGLRGNSHLNDRLLRGGAKIVSQMLKSGEVKSVLRLGDVPLGRYWRDLDQLKIRTVSLTSKPWSGSDKSQVVQMDLESLDISSLQFEQWDYSHWQQLGRVADEKFEQIFNTYPKSEHNFFRHVDLSLNLFDSIYIGNSLPVRLWDMTCRHSRIYSANRGANGIDGQLSTAIGLMKPDSKNIVILGDLTTLYDFSGLWLTKYLIKNNISVQLVVVNNQGGQIFSRIFNNPLFINEHNLSFENFATMWGWDFQSVEQPSQTQFTTGLKLIEWKPDFQQTQDFWKSYDQLWKK